MNASIVAAPAGNCSSLAARNNFAEYIKALNETTNFEEAFLESCKGEICNALWGNGNADISGIGMIVGYLLCSLLGIFFTVILAFHTPFSSRDTTAHKKLFLDGFHRFFNSLAYFSASIQIACIISLVRKDFGISANGLGGITVKITWAVALLCMLPLLYPMVMLPVLDDYRQSKNHSKSDGDPRKYRLFLFTGCWLPFFYTFISQMIGSFAPSQIGTGVGEGGTTIITDQEWQKLTAICLSDIKYLSLIEQKILSSFGAAGAILVAAYGVLSLVWLIMSRVRPSKPKNEKRAVIIFTQKRVHAGKLLFVLTIVPILTATQLWGVFRLRSIQKALAEKTSNVYVDNQWTFGQVVAVMSFAPLFVEMIYQWIHEPKQITGVIGY